MTTSWVTIISLVSYWLICRNEFCLQRKILTRPLFETDDIKVLKAVQQTIERNRIFRFTHKRQLSKMSSGIRQYIVFLKTHRREEPAAPDTPVKVPLSEAEKPVSADPLINMILNAQIEFIDNRNKGGALWIIGAEENQPFVDECAERGIIFRFKAEGSRTTGGTAAWWTKHGTEKISVEENAANLSR